MRNFFDNLFWTIKLNVSITPFYHLAGIVAIVITGIASSLSIQCVSGIIDSGIAFFKTGGAIQTVFFWAALLLFFFVLEEIGAIIRQYTVAIGFCEKPAAELKVRFAKRCFTTPLIQFEDASFFNMQKLVFNTIDEERSGIVMESCLYIGKEVVRIITVSIVLSRFSPLLLVLCFISAIPYLVTRLIRGKQFYELKTFQAPQERKLEYLWSLFTDKQAAKELRLTGSDSYVKRQWLGCRKEIFSQIWSLRYKDTISIFVCEFFTYTAFAAAVFFSLYLLINGKISAGNFSACITGFLMMQNSVHIFLNDLGRLEESVSLMGNMKEFFSCILHNNSTNF